MTDLDTKLSQLEALAQHPSTPRAEAEAALLGIQRLMQKHNITTFRRTLNDRAALVITQRRYTMPNSAWWRSDLLIGIARVNHCRALVHRHHGSAVTLIGTDQSIATSNDIYHLYAPIVERESSTVRPDSPMQSVRSYRHSFRAGMVDGIIRQLKDAAAETSSEDNAIVLVVDQHVASFMASHYPRLGSVARSGPTNASGWSSGFDRGKSISARKELS